MEVIWVGMAYLLGLGASTLRLPPLVGYLGAGLALSAFGLTGGELLHEIGHLGVLFLLFTVGLHLRFRNVLRPEVLGAGGIHLLLSVVLFGAVGLLMGFAPVTALIAAVVLGFSSTVLAAKSLEARDELSAYHGRVAIGILILQDLVAIGVLAVTGGGVPSPWALGLLAVPLLRPVLLRLLARSEQEELMLLFGLLLALGGGALFEAVGMSSELGALVAGALLAGTARADELAEKLWGLKEAFLVGFFLEVGLAGMPTADGLLLGALLLALLPVKAVLFFGLLVAFRLRARTAFMAATSLTSYSEFMLIAGAAAATSGLLPESLIVVFALVVAVSYALGAPLGRAANALWARYDHGLVRFERDVKHPDFQPRSLGGAHYLVVGMGQAGTAAYEYLAEHGEQPVGLDSDPGRIAAHRKAGRRVLFGDAQDAELWEALALDGLEAVMLALPSTEAKVRATRLLRQEGFTGPISALTVREAEHDALVAAGASSVCLPITQAGRELAAASLAERSNTDGASVTLAVEPS